MLEKNAKDFAEEVVALAKKAGIKPEKRHKENDDWSFRVFGFVGPLIGSVFGTLFLVLFSWLVGIMSTVLGMLFFTDVSYFITNNVHWFFVLFLFFGYSEYFSKRFRKRYWVVSPFVSGTGLVFVIWLAIWALNLVNVYGSSIFVANLSNFLYANMIGIMFVFIVLDYVLIVIEKIIITEGM